MLLPLTLITLRIASGIVAFTTCGVTLVSASGPTEELPSPLVLESGADVADAKTWNETRRPEVLNLFQKHVYGRPLAPAAALDFQTVSEDSNALGGKAQRRQIDIRFTKDPQDPTLHLLVYTPKDREPPYPTFVALNFRGNHTIHNDPAIRLGNVWISKSQGVEVQRATESSRGTRSHRWPVETIIERGYALATAYYGDIDPDFHDGFENGVHRFQREEPQPRPEDAPGSIAAWAWGLSRIMDYFEDASDIDDKRVAVMGHSRLGKTALWAGASDPRFALVISNNSGCGGAALSRRRQGETVAKINEVFPHWFCDGFKKYDEREDALPIDQHMLIALIAPRPVYIASAIEDTWADPEGEFLSARHAHEVYRLLGKEGLPADTYPPVDKPVMGTIGYHVRKGGHDVKEWDWARFLDFADRHLGG